MSYRDSYEAAQARIAQLEDQLRRVIEAAARGQVNVQSLEAEIQAQRQSAEVEILKLTLDAEAQEREQREAARIARTQLEARVLVLESALAAAEARLVACQRRLAAR